MNIATPTSRIPLPAPAGARRGGFACVGRPPRKGGCSQCGSVLVIVLWVSVGLVSIALYFANSMTYELRASDNRLNGLVSDQAIEGAARYVSGILQTYGTNGVAPNNTQFACAAVPIGDGRFWLIGRDPSESTTSTGPYFGLIDEGGKLNLNHVTTNTLSYLPNMTAEFAQYIVDWSSTNESDVDSMDYSMLGYYPKSAPFETVDELRLVYGSNMEMLYGDDLNFNGVLDGNEKSVAGAGQINYGLLEYMTAWTREPNFFFYQGTVSNKIDVNVPSNYLYPTGQMSQLLQGANISTSFILTLSNSVPYTNLLAFAVAAYQGGMNSADFDKIYNYVSTYDTNTSYINTASSDVLTALFEGLPQINGDENTASSAAQTLISYRKQNPSNIDTLMWVVDALGTTSPIITALDGGDFITTRSYQFTADIGAVGAFGRGYRRVKFVFDTTGGTPIIVYRQDLSSLGWALGDTARQDLLANNKTPQ